jgi:hypothetical protein
MHASRLRTSVSEATCPTAARLPASGVEPAGAAVVGGEPVVKAGGSERGGFGGRGLRPGRFSRVGPGIRAFAPADCAAVVSGAALRVRHVVVYKMRHEQPTTGTLGVDHGRLERVWRSGGAGVWRRGCPPVTGCAAGGPAGARGGGGPGGRGGRGTCARPGRNLHGQRGVVFRVGPRAFANRHAGGGAAACAGQQCRRCPGVGSRGAGAGRRLGDDAADERARAVACDPCGSAADAGEPGGG